MDQESVVLVSIMISMAAFTVMVAGSVAGGFVGPQGSNADDLDDLGGPFGTAGGSVTLPGSQISIGGDIAVGKNDEGEQIVTITGGPGASVPGTTPAEFHGGVTWTETYGGNIRDIAGAVQDGVTDAANYAKDAITDAATSVWNDVMGSNFMTILGQGWGHLSGRK